MQPEARVSTEVQTLRLAARSEMPLLERTVVQVTEGSVALQVAVCRSDKPALRRFLFTARPGAILVGCRLPAGSTTKLLAIADQESVIRSVDIAGLTAEEAGNWLREVASSLRLAHCTLAQEVRSGETRTIPCGADVQGSKSGATLLRVESGGLSFAGYSEIKIASGDPPFLFPFGVFASAATESSIATVAADGLSPDALWDATERTQQMLVHAFELVQARSEEGYAQRALAREGLNERISTEAVRNLTDLTTKGGSLHFSREGTPATVAVRALVEADGYSVEPASSGDENELLGIVERSRLRMRKVLLREGWWKHDDGPLVGYRGDERRPVALLPTSSGRYRIFDPQMNDWARVDERIADELDPVAHQIYRSFADHANSFFDTLRFGLKGHSRDLKVLAAAAAGASLLDLSVPAGTGLLVDFVIPYADRSLLWQLGVVLAVAAAGSFCLQLVQALTLTRVQSAWTHVCQAAFWDKLLRLSPAFFRATSVGQLQQRALSIMLIDLRLQTWTVQSLTSALYATVLLLAMLFYSPALGLIHGAGGLLLLIASVISSMRVGSLGRVSEELAGELSGATVQIIGGISKLRVAAAEPRAFAVWGRAFTRQQRQERAIQNVEDRMRGLNALIPILTLAVAIWYAAEIQLTGRAGATIGLGTLVTILAVSATYFRALAEISLRSGDVAAMVNLWNSGKSILETHPEFGERKMHPGNLVGRVSIEHVSFRYRLDGPVILDNVSMEIEPGECVAIAGPSGSGKSTLVNLLLGFENPLSGSVLYDGQDLAGIDLRVVRSQIGVVMQETRIMGGSVWELITGGTSASLEDAWQAARSAGIAEEIQAMPMGMHTVIAEGGTNISGGQRQRLLIARALVLRPRILIFDEATSALDNRTQEIVTESLARLSMTRILIAHRLSTIRNASRVYVLRGGQLVEQGTYEELIRLGGAFAQLVKRQTL